MSLRYTAAPELGNNIWALSKRMIQSVRKMPGFTAFEGSPSSGLELQTSPPGKADQTFGELYKPNAHKLVSTDASL